MTTKTAQTENDILKGLVRRNALSELSKDLNAQISAILNVKEKTEASSAAEVQAQLQKDQLRLIAKIWTALCKLIRSQSNKNRIIDSLYFGSFGKSSVLAADENAPKTFSYCPGPRSVFNLVENVENLASVDQAVSSLSNLSPLVQFSATVLILQFTRTRPSIIKTC